MLGVELMSFVGGRAFFSHSVAKAAPSLGAPDIGDGQQLIVIPEVQREPRTRFLSAFQLPERLTFAGQLVPLDNWQVRERIEYEFYQFLADEGQSVILAKRSGRCFPQFEQQLAAAGLPDDLKYLLLLDSKCPNTVSVPYQRGTSQRRQTRASFVPLNRRQLELSVETTMARLTAVKAKTGDWFLAMAAYLAGEDHVQRALAEQRVREYWKLSDNRDVMRYVPRLIAAKEIYSHPDRYLGLDKEDLYAPVETETVTVQVTEPNRHLAAIANDLGTYYLELRFLNPQITHDSLPRGTHTLKVAKQRVSTP
jgi:membrane-bound lytic murein transglycosylase D